MDSLQSSGNLQNLQQPLIYLAIFTAVAYAANQILKMSKLDTEKTASELGQNLMKLPRPAMMILMAIPEQVVMYMFEPQMPLINRLLVSVAMYLIHFAWNGMVMKPKRSYNELVWIIGTALYAMYGLGARQETVMALIAADSVMTLALRGLTV